MGRIVARLLIAALKSSVVQSKSREVTDYLARRGTAFILRKLRAGSKPFSD